MRLTIISASNAAGGAGGDISGGGKNKRWGGVGAVLEMEARLVHRLLYCTSSLRSMSAGARGGSLARKNKKIKPQQQGTTTVPHRMFLLSIRCIQDPRARIKPCLPPCCTHCKNLELRKRWDALSIYSKYHTIIGCLCAAIYLLPATIIIPTCWRTCGCAGYGGK